MVSREFVPDIKDQCWSQLADAMEAVASLHESPSFLHCFNNEFLSTAVTWQQAKQQLCIEEDAPIFTQLGDLQTILPQDRVAVVSDSWFSTRQTERGTVLGGRFTVNAHPYQIRSGGDAVFVQAEDFPPVTITQVELQTFLLALVYSAYGQKDDYALDTMMDEVEKADEPWDKITAILAAFGGLTGESHVNTQGTLIKEGLHDGIAIGMTEVVTPDDTTRQQRYELFSPDDNGGIVRELGFELTSTSNGRHELAWDSISRYPDAGSFLLDRGARAANDARADLVQFVADADNTQARMYAHLCIDFLDAHKRLAAE